MENHPNYLHLVKGLPIFNELSDDELVQIMAQENVVRFVSYKPGEKLIVEKRFDRKIFLMIRGSVEVSKGVSGQNGKSEKVIQVVEGKGNFLGEITAFTGKPRTASVIAREETVCLMINVAVLMETSSGLLDRMKSRFYPRLFELLCTRLAEMDEGYVRARQKNEEFVKKIFEIKREKMEMKDYYEEEIRNKHMEIARLQGVIEELQSRQSSR